ALDPFVGTVDSRSSRNPLAWSGPFNSNGATEHPAVPGRQVRELTSAKWRLGGDPMLIEFAASAGVGRYGATRRRGHDDERDVGSPRGDPKSVDHVRAAVCEA